MDELMDLLVKDESPSQISDKIKDILFAKSAEMGRKSILLYHASGSTPHLSNVVLPKQPVVQRTFFS